MQRIPSFNPGNTTTYPGGNGPINVGAANEGSKLLLYNESPFNLDIDFLNGSQSILHAWEARYWTLDGDTKQVEWSIDTALNVSGPPISLVMGELYDASEKLEGTYPLALIRQTNVGNQGGIATTSSTGITNDGNNAGTSIIEATVSGQTQSSVSLTNDALLKLLVVIAGALVQVLKTNNADPVLQLGAASHITELLGTLQLDNPLQFGSASAQKFLDTLGGGSIFLDASSNTDLTLNAPNQGGGHQINFQVGGVTYATLTSGGMIFGSGKMQIGEIAAGDRIAVVNSTYIKSTAGNKVIFQIPGGTNVASIDGSGNMILKGTLTQNGAP